MGKKKKEQTESLPKAAFLRLLTRASQPVGKKEPAPSQSKTSA